TGGMFELDLVVDAPSGKKFSLTLANENDDSVTLYCDDEMLFDRTASGETGFEKGFAAKHRAVRPSGTCILLTVFVDASSVEIFANRGEVVMTELVFPATPYTRVLFQSDEGVEIKTATLYELRSILEGRNIDVSR